MIGIKQKQPADSLDYDLGFEDCFTDDDTITSATAAVDPAGELTVDSVVISGLVVKLWVSGGVAGKTYKVSVTAATAGGRIKEVDFKIRVRDC